MSDLKTALSRLGPETPGRQRIEACHTLGRSKASSAVRPLLKLLDVAEEPAIRRAAALALGEIGDADALPALELTPATNSRYDDHFGDLSSLFGQAASRCREGLISSERRKDVRRLLKGLRSDQEYVVRRCQEGLADWGKHALKGLRRVLEDDDPTIRLRAVLAAERILRRDGDLMHDVVSLLLPRLDDDSTLVRRQVPLSLRYRRDPRLEPALIERLRDPEPAVRLQAMLALEAIDAFSAIPEIQRLATTDPAEIGPNDRLDAKAASVLATLRRKQAGR